MTQSVQIVVSPIRSCVRGYIPKQAYQKIDSLLSYRLQKAEYVPSFQTGKWDGRIRLFDMKDLSFPTGLLSKLIGLLGELSIAYAILDKRPVSAKTLDLQWVHPEIKQLYDYQLDTVKAVEEKKVGIVQAATGAGKTCIMCKFIQELGRKTLVLVHKLDLLEQARNEIIESLGIEVGYIGNQTLDIKDVTVGTVQTIVKSLGIRYLKFMDDEVDEKVKLKEQEKEQIRHLLRTVNVVVIDECHHVRSETQQSIMNAVTVADYRIGLSATPMRDQGDDLLIEGIFGDILCRISATYLIERGYLIPPEIRFNNINYTIFDFFEFVKVDDDGNVFYCDPVPPSSRKRRRKIDMHWPELADRKVTKMDDVDKEDIIYVYSDGTRLVRRWLHYEGDVNMVHHIYVKLEEICSTVFQTVIIDTIERDSLTFQEKDSYKKFLAKMKRKYNDLVMKKKYNFIYDACITDNDYRNEYIAQSINLHRMLGRSVLALVRRLRHGENIRKFLEDDIPFLKGEDDIDIRNDAMEKIRNRELRAVIASTIADEGLNLPALDSIVMAGGGTSKTTALQRVGRALRLFPGKEKAYVEEFDDAAQYLSKHSNDRREIYKTEPAFNII